MMVNIWDRFVASRLWVGLMVIIVLLGAVFFGTHPSKIWLALLVVGLGAVLLIQQPLLGLPALVFAALLIPMSIGTGSAVALNPATVLVPALLAHWLLNMLVRREVRLAPSATNRPLFLFLLAGLLSLLIGNALWDPAVPREGDFIVVQLAQWTIFVFSAGAFWLMGNLVRQEIWLHRLTFLFLVLGGGLAILRVLPGGGGLVFRIATTSLTRAPFWMLLAALAGGQLIFNPELSGRWRVFLFAVLGAVLVYAFYLKREDGSNWVGVAAVAGVLAWLRWPRLRWPVMVLLPVLAVSGLLTSALYEFGGGDAEWQESGGSRLALTGRVVEVTMRNPVTGLGPASYRRYAAMKPLRYRRALYNSPNINSHNNYVDLFAHGGLLGLALFLWFAAELIRLGFRLRAHFTQGFAAGYVNAMLAAWVGALVVMLLLDWILPFVYNVGFPGFQASVLVWLFLGGLVALDVVASRARPQELDHAT